MREIDAAFLVKLAKNFNTASYWLLISEGLGWEI